MAKAVDRRKQPRRAEDKVSWSVNPSAIRLGQLRFGLYDHEGLLPLLGKLNYQLTGLALELSKERNMALLRQVKACTATVGKLIKMVEGVR